MDVVGDERPRMPRLGITADSGLLVATDTPVELERFAQLCLTLRTRGVFPDDADDAGNLHEDRWAELADALLTDRFPKPRAQARGPDFKALALNRHNSFDALIWTLLTVFDEVERSTVSSFCIAIPHRSSNPAAASTSIEFDRTPEVFWVCPGAFVDTRSGKLVVKTPFWCVAALRLLPR